MNYTLTLSLDTGQSEDKMDLVVLDRDKKILPIEVKQQNNYLYVTLQITMPNRLIILLTGKDLSKDNETKFVKITGMSLGGVRFNNKKLDDLFEYKADHGTAYNPLLTVDDYLKFDSDKTTHWDRNGCVVLELFDKDPIRYHLNLETQGLATI
jgi:hypothetical protein